jgi:hypothetical protein
MGLVAITVTLLTMVRRRPPSAATEGAVIADSLSGWEAVRRELDRSRRYERPFVLIRIPCARDGATLLETLRPFLRNHDLLWASGENVYAMLPEGRRAMGQALIARVRSAQPHLLPAAARVVAFPEDAVTGGALIALLHDQAIARHSVPFTADRAPALETS